MKHFKLLLILAVVAGVFFTTSCSDDDDNSNPVVPTTGKNDDYFKITKDSWWKYSRHIIKDDGSIDDASKEEFTRTFSKVESFLGESSMLFLKDKDQSEQHYYTGKGTIYSTAHQMFPDIQAIKNVIPFDKVENKWVVLADINKTTWEAMTFKVTDHDVSATFGKEAKANGDYAITIKKASKDETLTVNGGSLQVREFTAVHTFKGTLLMPSAETALNMEYEIKYWFAENKGLIKVKAAKQEVAIGLAKLPVPGFEEHCIEVKIAPAE